jgi:hypothetical protein
MSRYAVLQCGSVVMHRGICSMCGDECFIVGDGKSSCCRSHADIIIGYVRKLSTSTRRKVPPIAKQEEILASQENRCYWCNREFGAYVMKRSSDRAYKLRPVWDHYIPYSYTGASLPNDFVASCRVCNSFKSAKLPLDEELLRAIIDRRWRDNGWVDL